MSPRNTHAAWRVRRSHEPNRLAGQQLALAYDAVLFTAPGAALPEDLCDHVTVPAPGQESREPAPPHAAAA
jgi:hypothetical protein